QAANKGQADGGGGDVGAAFAGHIAAQEVVKRFGKATGLPMRAQGGSQRPAQQQDQEGCYRQQWGHHEPQPRMVFEDLNHRPAYPFNSSALSTSTVQWLL